MNKVRIEAEGAKGRKDQDEGRGGRKGEDLSEDELPEELGKDEDAAKKDEEAGCVGGEGAEGRPGCVEFEVRKPRIARRPLLPTKAEVDEHYPLHLNYRSWCAHCVAGKARSNPHVQSKEDKEKLGVTWNIDYAFMSGEHNASVIVLPPALIFYDDHTECFCAFPAELLACPAARAHWARICCTIA